MSRPNKEAVVFLLDAHPSMNAPYPSNAENGGSTRLSCAKEALEGMVSQLMIQSKQNEVGVIVLNTEPVKTEEGFEDDDSQNPYMTSLALPAVTRPSIEVLQAIRRVECSKTDYSGADVCQGMAMAEKALRNRTFKKRYARRLVVFTDAAHRVESPNEVILRVIDNLRELECTLTVIGVDFENSAKFEEPLAKDKAAVKSEQEKGGENDEKKMPAADDSDATDNESEGEEEESGDDDDDDEEEDMQNIKNQNEQLLISVARLTGGSIIAASTMKEIAEAALGKRIPKSMKKKIKLNIAPGISLDARCSMLLSRASFPSLKKDAMQLDEKTNEPKVDGNGEIMSHPVKTFTDHFNAESLDEEVSESNRTHGYRYGADCIPMSSVDKEGIRLFRSDPALTIMGYVDQATIPRAFLLGPPYAVFGHDSHRTCCAVAALAKALHQMNKVAICTYFKTNKTDPILCGLYPLEEDGKSEPTRLFFMQLPFADDKRPYNLPPLEPSESDSAESRACDDLIDALMLPPDALKSQDIASPSIRSFHKTVKSRAIDPSSTDIVAAREEPSMDPMSTPAEVLMGASAALETFCTTFPRQKVAEEEAKGKKKKKYWTEHED